MFGKPSISDYYRAVLKSLEESVQRSDAAIAEKDASAVVADLIKSAQVLQPIEFDASRKETMKHRKEIRRVPAHRREEFYRDEGDVDFEYETIDVVIPIVSNPTIRNIRDLEPSTHSLSWSADEFQWGEDSVRFSLDIKGYGFKYEDNQVVNEIERRKKYVHEWAGWVNRDIQHETEALSRNLLPFVENRKKKLSEDKGRIGGLSEKLGISLEE